MKDNYKYLLFDLDGTLTDSAPGIHNSFRYALHAMGEPEPSIDDLKLCVGPPLWDSFQNRFGMTGERLDEALRQYQVYYAPKGLYENSVYEGVYGMLETLRGKGYTLAVASSKKEIHVKTVLEHFDLLKFFALYAGSDAAVGRMDKKDVIRHAMGLLDASGEDAVMIGDRHHDAEGARACGIPCAGVLWGYGTREELETAGAMACFETPRELAGYF